MSTTNLSNEIKITRWTLSRLKPHPRQESLFTDLSDELLKDLADDLKANGLHTPVEALPDGTIVCGHQRVKAATMLGWDEIDVLIRHDLAEQGEAAIEQRLIADNLHRRQLSRLDLGRCYLRLRELELGMPREKRHGYSYGSDLRDVIGKRLGASGRTLDRYLAVLRTPLEVQQAFERGEIPLVDAGRVANLPKASQEQLVERIRQGEPTKQAVDALIRARPNGYRTSKMRDKAGQALLAAHEVERLSSQGLDERTVRTLRQAHDLIGELLKKASA